MAKIDREKDEKLGYIIARRAEEEPTKEELFALMERRMKERAASRAPLTVTTRNRVDAFNKASEGLMNCIIDMHRMGTPKEAEKVKDLFFELAEIQLEYAF